mgnify:CR=1 FL=1
METEGFQKEINLLRQEIALKYGVEAPTLERQIRKLGRGLPKFERGQARMLIDAERALQHPKMALKIQSEPFSRAKLALMVHLEKVDPGDQWKCWMVRITTVVLVNLLIALSLGLAFAAWRGLI